MAVKRILILLVVVLLVGLACTFSPAAAPGGPSQDAVATSVAGTLAAGQPPIPPAQPVEAPAAPTLTPVVEVPQVLQIAYTDSTYNLWLWKEGAAPAPLAGTGDVFSVLISDDGTLAAFVRSSNGTNASLWVVNMDGTNSRPLVSAENLLALGKNPAAFPENPTMANDIIGVNFYGLQWIPQTHTLAFSSQPYFEGPGLFINNDLQLVNADTGEQSTLLAPGQGGAATYSPDGSKLVVVTPQRISLLNRDGSNRFEVLTYPQVITYSEYQYYVEPQWAPDSGSLLVAIPPADPLAQPPQATTIYRIPVDGSPAAAVSSVVATFLNNIKFSPDMTKMAYTVEAGLPEGNQRTLHIANVDGSNDAAYHTGVMVTVDGWSPDSTRFVFSIGDSRSRYLGQIGVGFVPLAESIGGVLDATWIGPARIFLLVDSGSGVDLMSAVPGGASSLILNLPGSYDFSWPSTSIYP
jgi:hypothetical protein